MGAHAFLAPSSAARWVRCALAPTLESQYPQREESPESLEGTAAHWVAQMLVQGTPVPIGAQAPNGVAVTEEMVEGAELVRDTVGPLEGLAIEYPVKIERIHPTQNWGTPDYFRWSRMNNGRLCLRVVDYKFGHGIVDAVENWQLIDYVAGILDAAKIDGQQDQELVVIMTVIQPRAPHRDGPVRSWIVQASDLRGYFNKLINAAGQAVNPNPKATPTPEGCEHCTGRHVCEALQREAYKAASTSEQYGAFELSPHALGLELRTLERAAALLKARITGLREEVEYKLKRGEVVPFWVMDSTPGRLGWTQDDGAILALGQVFGLDIAKPLAPITATQAKDKAKKAGLPVTIFDSVTARASGAVKLMFDDGTKARLTFSSSATKIEPL